MTVDKCTFHGIENCLKLSDGTIELYITTDFGPRIIGAGFAGGQNFMCEFKNELASVSENKWQSYGGHRFWTAPEAFPRSYPIDNKPYAWKIEGDTVLLDIPEEKENGIKKQMTVSIADGKVTLCHTVTNTGRWEIEAAAWSLTVMAPGGKVIVPQEKYIPQGSGEGQTLLPGRAMAIWPYTDMSDERFVWGKNFIEMSEAGGSGEPLKFGLFNSLGFAAYELNGEYFVKRFAAYSACAYPDFGCNCEFFTMRGMLEVESLSPLVLLAPGESIAHTEEWTFFSEKPDFLK